jgi:hypothetical protein
VKIVRKDPSLNEYGSFYAIFNLFARNANEAKRKALRIPYDSENWKVDSCWKKPAERRKWK